MSVLGTMVAGTKMVAAGRMVVDAVNNFENFSGTCLPQLVLLGMMKYAGANAEQLADLTAKLEGAERAAANKTTAAVIKPQGGSVSNESSQFEKHLPNEQIYDVGGVKVDEHVSDDGTKSEKVTTLNFRTIDKDISSFVNLKNVFNMVKEGKMPDSQLLWRALLDVVDILDFGIFGEDLTKTRLEPYVKNRKITVTDTVTHENIISPVKIKENLQQLQQSTQVQSQKVTLEGDNIDKKTLSEEELKVKETTLQETTESERTFWEKVLGNEVQVTQRTYVKSEVSHTRTELNDAGEMKPVFSESNTQTNEISKLITKDWRAGYIKILPVVGSGTDIVRRYQAGVEVTVGDWISFAKETAVTAMSVYCAWGLVGSMLKSGASTVTRVATKQVGNRVAKATLNSKSAAGALKKFYENPRQVFSPERIAAKTRTVAHNPMKESLLKSVAHLSKLEQKGVKIGPYLRKQFADMGAEGKLIADSLTRNLRYLKQNKWLTPENIARMEKGLNPWGYIKGTGKFRLDVDHIIPKSLDPALKAHPGNLTFLPQLDNIRKSNNIMRHVVQHVDRFVQAKPDWRPSTELLDKIGVYVKDLPNIKVSPALQDILNNIKSPSQTLSGFVCY